MKNDVEALLKGMKAVHIDRSETVCLPINTTVRDAIDELRATSSGCVLVVEEPDGPRLRGIFTDYDVVKKVVGNAEAYDRPVSEFMTADPQSILDGDTVAKAIHLMHRDGFRHLPILEGSGKVVGVVTKIDVVRFLADQYPEHVYNIPPDPDQVAETPEGG